jgi:hypothetical protein
MTFGAFTPHLDMKSPFIRLLNSHVWHFWRMFSCIFVLKVFLGVYLRPIHLVSWIYYVLGILGGYYLIKGEALGFLI